MCKCGTCVYGVLADEDREFPEFSTWECQREWSELECQYEDMDADINDDIEDTEDYEHEDLEIEMPSPEDLHEWMYPYGVPHY